MNHYQTVCTTVLLYCFHQILSLLCCGSHGVGAHCQPWTCGSRTWAHHFADLTGHRDLFCVCLRGKKAKLVIEIHYSMFQNMGSSIQKGEVLSCGRALSRLFRGAVESSLGIFKHISFMPTCATCCDRGWDSWSPESPSIPWKTSQTLRCSFAFDQALCISATCDFSFLLQTYNQSQSNRRSIQKAISGNKMLHFYQHSPRMIPEGINPELHRMFITAEKYKPNDSGRLPKGRPSSLHHKSALFSCVTGKRIMVFSLSTPQAAISCCYLTAYEKCLLTWVWVSSRSALLAAVTFQLCYSALTLPSFPLTSSHHSSAFKGLSFRSDLCFILLCRASHRGNGWGSETWATKRRGKC